MSDAGLAVARLREALSLDQQGRHAEAFPLAEEALRLFVSADDRTGQALAHHLCGSICVALGRPMEGLHHLEAAVPLREGGADPEGLAALLHQLGDLALAVGDLDRAERAAQSWVGVQESRGDREGLAQAIHRLAELRIQSGKPARELVERGLWLSDRAGEERGRAAFLLLGARLDLAEGKDDRAERGAREAVELAATVGRPSLADALHTQGALLANIGRLDAALSALERCLDLREALRDLPGRGEVLALIAQVEEAMGRPGEAIDRLRYAVKTFLEVGRTDLAMESLHAASETAARAGRGSQALTLALEQLEMCEALGDPGLSAAAWLVVGQRHIEEGALSAAVQAFLRSADARAQAGQPEARAVALAMAAQAQAAMGEPGLARLSLAEALAALPPGSELESELKGLLEGSPGEP